MEIVFLLAQKKILLKTKHEILELLFFSFQQILKQCLTAEKKNIINTKQYFLFIFILVISMIVLFQSLRLIYNTVARLR